MRMRMQIDIVLPLKTNLSFPLHIMFLYYQYEFKSNPILSSFGLGWCFFEFLQLDSKEADENSKSNRKWTKKLGNLY